MLAEIIVVRRGRVRRAKLYYLRNLTGKATRIKEKKIASPCPRRASRRRVTLATAVAPGSVEADRAGAAKDRAGR